MIKLNQKQKLIAAGLLALTLYVFFWYYESSLSLILWIALSILFYYILFKSVFTVVSGRYLRILIKLLVVPLYLMSLFGMLLFCSSIDDYVFGNKVVIARDDEIPHSVSEYIVVREKNGKLTGQGQFNGFFGRRRYDVELVNQPIKGLKFINNKNERAFLLNDENEIIDMANNRKWYVDLDKLSR